MSVGEFERQYMRLANNKSNLTRVSSPRKRDRLDIADPDRISYLSKYSNNSKSDNG